MTLNKLPDFSFHLYKISLLVFTSRVGELDKIIHEEQLDPSHSKSLMIVHCYYFNYNLIGLFECLVGKHLIHSLVDIWFFHEQERGERERERFAGRRQGEGEREGERLIDLKDQKAKVAMEKVE